MLPTKSRLNDERPKPCDSTAYVGNLKSPTETEPAEIVKNRIGLSGEAGERTKELGARGNGRSGDRQDSLLLDLT